MRFQVLRATKFKITFLWDVMRTSWVDIDRSFVIPMKKGTTNSTETLIVIRMHRVTSCLKGWTQLLYKDSSGGILSVRGKSLDFNPLLFNTQCNKIVSNEIQYD